VNHASGTVTPPDPELIQVGDVIGQRAQRRGLVQTSIRPVPVVEVPVLASSGSGVTEPAVDTPFEPYYAAEMLTKLQAPGDEMVDSTSSQALLRVHAVRDTTAWNSQQHVNYIDQNGDVHELVYKDNEWTHTILSWAAAATGGTAAYNLPRQYSITPVDGYATPWNGQQHVNYVSQDCHIHELISSEGAGWVHNDLSAHAGLRGVISIRNERTGQQYSPGPLTPPLGASCNGDSAEWVMEAPLITSTETEK
jgi:hypothetical protein